MTAFIEGGYVDMTFGFDDIQHLLKRSRAIVQFVEMGEPS